MLRTWTTLSNFWPVAESSPYNIWSYFDVVRNHEMFGLLTFIFPSSLDQFISLVYSFQGFSHIFWQQVYFSAALTIESQTLGHPLLTSNFAYITQVQKGFNFILYWSLMWLIWFFPGIIGWYLRNLINSFVDEKTREQFRVLRHFSDSLTVHCGVKAAVITTQLCFKIIHYYHNIIPIHTVK